MRVNLAYVAETSSLTLLSASAQAKQGKHRDRRTERKLSFSFEFGWWAELTSIDALPAVLGYGLAIALTYPYSYSPIHTFLGHDDNHLTRPEGKSKENMVYGTITSPHL
jgi:hypothetical protein